MWAWLTAIANRRTHASTGLILVDALAVDRAAMVALQPVAPTTGDDGHDAVGSANATSTAAVVRIGCIRR